MIEALDNAIYTKLNTTTAVTTSLSAATAIYAGQAPTNAAAPYIVYAHAAGGDDNETPVDSADVAYYIKVVAKTQKQAAEIADEIRTALHGKEATFTIDAPWTAYRIQAQEIISFIENVEKTQLYHKGNKYRFRISQ